MQLAVELAPNRKCNLLLSNPILTASGTFGNGLEYAKFIDIQNLGAIVTKAVTLRPRRGNRQPRIVETTAGMLNSIGLQNIGLKAIIKEVAPIWAKWRVPVIVNIAGENIMDYALLARELDNVDGVSGLELNISCPNIDDGLEFGGSPKMAGAVTKAARRESTLPLIVKLTPNASDICSVAQAIADEGADAITVANTFSATGIDAEENQLELGWGAGGLSGPALKPINLKLVCKVASTVTIPVIGCGGIMNEHDALDYILAGAVAVQIGTATFTNPRAALDIMDGLEGLLREQGVEKLSHLVGANNNTNATQ